MAAFTAARPKSAPPLSRSELMEKAAKPKETIFAGPRASNQRGQFPVCAILCNMEFKKTTTNKMETLPTSWLLRKATTFSPPKVTVQDDLLAAMQEADEQSEMSVSATTNYNNPCV
ncbi:hypothetical protein FIBSPDRAFT_111930 [Athelia psychrophila]|uniref:Uncharacterized protein n=1 Tax=Athelia psychrophila TaxID=1759441 RepID=A0A166TFP0_9AGAM|nr:hypothetical protein FIBSPDRAFT_111930 [Fibularhizoctonia sp. CBS 109695]